MSDHQQGLTFETPDTNEPVECLGRTFESDEARREHFLELLREFLQDPSFRKRPGFPEASDEAILRMSDPPFYTACPNPFLEGLVQHRAKPYDPNKDYDRSPFTVDVSEGKYDWLYRAHSYHTKVPHLAIVPSILHYTEPGDVILDGFCGSGMLGVAVQHCTSPSREYKAEVEQHLAVSKSPQPIWGERYAVLNDLSPAATFISSGYTLPFSFDAFNETLQSIVDASLEEVGWMYETDHEGAIGTINFTVWSQVFSCPECAGDIIFADVALDPDTKKTKKTLTCPHCSAELKKGKLDTVFESKIDPLTGSIHKAIKIKPTLINYSYEGEVFEKEPGQVDVDKIRAIEELPYPSQIPLRPFNIDKMYHGSRLAPKGFTHVHHLFLRRSAHVISEFWSRAIEVENAQVRRALLFAIEQVLTTGSVLNRYRPGSSFGNGPLRGVYYVSSMIAEASVFNLVDGIQRRMKRGFEGYGLASYNNVAISTGDCANIELADHSVDYVFTDPPFGENIFYADLNFIVESWHRVITSATNEAIVDKKKSKGVHEYQELMRRCFQEYYRVLKPGRWMTVVFSNSSNSIWRAIQEAMGTAGFVVADVRTLDKKHGSYRQVTSSAVKQDLIISAYKPREVSTDRFELEQAGEDSAWAFVNEHLRHVPVFVGHANEGEVIAERTEQMLLDRMIAFHVQRGASVPLSGPEFTQGLARRYPSRDGMYFLPDQVAEYDRKRMTIKELRQLSLFVNDEETAIRWVRQQLHDKPQSLQDLTPQFTQQIQSWDNHEVTVELRDILQDNFLEYDGEGPVPSQIHAYLSSNFKPLRNLEKDDPALVEKATGRWYVPDPNKQADLDQLRERALLKEFEEYKGSEQDELKKFRTEAVRVGFKACWQENDYAAIVAVAQKLPESVLQEDPKLLMYFDTAQMRLGDE